MTGATDGILLQWTKRWENDDIPWHRTERNQFLMKYEDKLLCGRQGIRILFPLCGKCVDMKWFYDQQHRVIGIEYNQHAIRSFFEEQKLEFIAMPINEKVTLFQTNDERLKIFCCDIFDFESDWIGSVDAVWDRGALVAVEKEDRKRYASKILSLLSPIFTYLLNVYVYDEWFFSGYPRNVPIELVEYLFGATCNIEILERTRVDGPLLNRIQLDKAETLILLLTPKV